MLRRIGIAVAIAAMAVALVAAPGAAGAKRKLQPGPYVGTSSNGIAMTITLNGDRLTGTFTYCDQTLPFTLAGNAFSVTNADGTIQASGVFTGLTKKQRQKRRKGTVSGSIPLGGGCDGTVQTFFIRHV